MLRIGILGAAKVAPTALIVPAQGLAGVTISAVAARDERRAREFAAKHGIPTVHASYEALINDPQVDAIYNPLPNGLHGHWTMAAIATGKHVLCEKPFAANAEEAARVAAKARERPDLVVMEAFHYRYHALTRRIQDVLASGEIGTVRHVEAWFNIPILSSNIRWDLALAGGSLMDVGCYTIHLLRTLVGAEPIVRRATARLRSPGVDRWFRAEFEFGSGAGSAAPVTGTITTSMLAWPLVSAGARVAGSDGTLQVSNPYLPQYYHRLTIRAARGERRETVPKQPSTFAAQLQTFVNAVLHGQPYPTDCADAIANMKVIDACYAAAGLARREPTRIPTTAYRTP